MPGRTEAEKQPKNTECRELWLNDAALEELASTSSNKGRRGYQSAKKEE